MEGSRLKTELTNGDLCAVMKGSQFSFTDRQNQQNVLEDHIISSLQLGDQATEEFRSDLQKKLSSFLAHAITRYGKESRKYDQFLNKNAKFLQHVFCLPKLGESNINGAEEKASEGESAPKKPKLGRKPVPFEDKTARGKQLASAKVRQLHEPGAIVLAASQQRSALGQLVKKAKSPSGTTARLALNAIKTSSVPG